MRAILYLSWILIISWGQSAGARDLSGLFEKVKSSVVMQGIGSGVLIDERRVLTAAHVVQAKDEVIVHFYDGQKLKAKVLSSSQQADVALLELKKKPKRVTPDPIGDSDIVKVGEPIFIVGASYGLSYTLTAGHISNRFMAEDIGGGFHQVEFFQTDASINQGNSGGPMFDM